MVEKVRFVSVTRVIDDRKGIHYLDAIGEDGFHYMAQMVHNINSDEPWLLYKKVWYKDPQQPYPI
jgi:hypothetical protein